MSTPPRRGPTPRSTVRRLPERGRYDRETIDAVLDEGLVCHVGFVDGGQPFVVPSAYARMGDRLVIHGSAASRMLKALAAGAPACVTVTLLDGLVLARSAFHHSMNYRSVVVLGRAVEVTDSAERMAAFEAIVEHVLPGRWSEVRWPTEQELRATTVLRLPLDEASAKVRSGDPIDDEEDLALDCWAGVIPFGVKIGDPVAAAELRAGISMSPAALGRVARR
jgi:hypothetical protein